MKRFDNLLLTVLLVLLASACDWMKPTEITSARYPESNVLLTNQTDLLEGKVVNKKVWLDVGSEAKSQTMDTTFLKRELAFLKEINPNQAEYVGAFEETNNDGKLVLVLGAEERGSLKRFEIQEQGTNTLISATIHEDKDVYIHHREIALRFSNQVLAEYTIEGYQKIILKDTVRFRIKGEIE